MNTYRGKMHLIPNETMLMRVILISISRVKSCTHNLRVHVSRGAAICISQVNI